MARNALSYVSNLGKSIVYSAVDEIKDMNPTITSFKDSNGDVFKSINSTIRTMNISKATKQLMESKYGDFAKSAWNNAWDDIRTGKLYNRERLDKGTDQLANDMFGLGDDDFGFSFEDDSSSSFDFSDSGSSDSIGSNDMMDLVGEKASMAISSTVAKSAQYTVAAQQEMNQALVNQQNVLFGRMHADMGTINQNISSLIDFARESTVSHYNNSKTFYETSNALDKERNDILKEMLEIQKNVYQPKKGSRTSGGNFSSLTNAEGIPDLKEYAKLIKKNKIDNGNPMLMMMNSFMTMGGFDQIKNSPMKLLTDALVKKMTPKLIKESMKEFNESLAGAFATALMNANGNKNNTTSPVIAALSNFFGLDFNLKKSLSTSGYKKDAIPFDGVTKKAITEVIPTYLSKILDQLSGTGETRYDYEKGEFVRLDDIKKGLNDITRDNAKTAANMSDLTRRLNEMVDKIEFKAVEDRKQLEKDIEAIVLNSYQKAEAFNPRKKNVSAATYGLKGDKAEANMRLIMEMFEKMPRSVLMNFNREILSRRDDQNETMMSKEEDGTDILFQLFNASSSAFKGKGSIKSPVINFGSYHQQSLELLSEIRKELAYIRTYGSPGGGSKRGNSKRPSYSSFKVSSSNNKSTSSATSSRANESNYRSSVNNASAGFMYDATMDPEMAAELFRQRVNLSENDPTNTSKGTYGKLKDAKSMSERYKIISQNIDDIMNRPVAFIHDVLFKMDESLFTMLYGPKEDKDGKKSIMGMMMGGFKETFSKFSGWLDENILQPVSEKLTPDGVKGAVKSFFNLFGVDIESVATGVSTKLFGVKGSNGDRKGGVFGDLMNDVKNSFKSVGSYIKGIFGSIGDWLGVKGEVNRKGRSKDKYNSNIDTRIADFAKAMGMGTTEEIPNAARGMRRVKRTGVVAVSEGEMIVPVDRNPNNIKRRLRAENRAKGKFTRNFGRGSGILSFAAGGEYSSIIAILASEEYSGMIGTEKTKLALSIIDIPQFESDVKAQLNAFKSSGDNASYRLLYNNYMDILRRTKKKKTKADYKKGSESFKYRVMDEAANLAGKVGQAGKTLFNDAKSKFDEAKDKAQAKKDETAFNKALADVMGRIREYAPDAIVGGVLGGGISLVTGLVGGPLLGAAAGAAISLVKNSTAVQELLFGEKLENGEYAGGKLFSKDIANLITKYVPSMAKGATAGLLTSLIPMVPGGPVAGIIVGSAAGFVAKNQKVQDALFGEEGKLKGLPDYVKKNLPRAIVGGVVGAAAGPFGLATNIMLGSAIGFASDTNKFKEIFFGEEDEHGNRIGGVFGYLRDSVGGPITEFARDAFEDLRQWFTKDVKDPLVEAFNPLKKQMELMFRSIYDLFKRNVIDKITMPIQRTVDKFIVKPLGRMLGGVANFGKGVFKTAVGVPVKAVSGVGRHFKVKQIKRGTADYMTAQERLEYRKEHPVKFAMGAGDMTADVDAMMASMDPDQLAEMQSNLGYARNAKGKADREIASANKVIKSKVLNDKSLDYRAAKTVKKLINKGDVDGATAYVDSLGISEEKKTSLKELIAVQGTKYRTALDAKRDMKGTEARMIDKLRKMGFSNLSPKNMRDYESLFGAELKSRKGNETITPTEQAKIQHNEVIDVVKQAVDRLQDLVDIALNKKPRRKRTKGYTYGKKPAQPTVIASGTESDYNDYTSNDEVEPEKKSLASKIKDKASSVVHTFYNGMVMRFVRTKDGSLTEDKGSASTTEAVKQRKEDQQTQKSILSSLTSIPGRIIEFFGGKRDDGKENNNLFGKILKIAGITSLVAVFLPAFVKIMKEKFMPWLSEKFDGVGKNILKSLLGDNAGEVDSVSSLISTSVSDFKDGFVDGFNQILYGSEDGSDQGKGAIEKLGNKIGDKVRDAGEALKEGFDNFKTDFIDGFINGDKEDPKSLAGKLGNLVSDIKNWFFEEVPRIYKDYIIPGMINGFEFVMGSIVPKLAEITIEAAPAILGGIVKGIGGLLSETISIFRGNKDPDDMNKVVSSIVSKDNTTLNSKLISVNAMEPMRGYTVSSGWKTKGVNIDGSIKQINLGGGTDNSSSGSNTGKLNTITADEITASDVIVDAEGNRYGKGKKKAYKKNLVEKASSTLPAAFSVKGVPADSLNKAKAQYEAQKYEYVRMADGNPMALYEVLDSDQIIGEVTGVDGSTIRVKGKELFNYPELAAEFGFDIALTDAERDANTEAMGGKHEANFKGTLAKAGVLSLINGTPSGVTKTLDKIGSISVMKRRGLLGKGVAGVTKGLAKGTSAGLKGTGAIHNALFKNKNAVTDAAEAVTNTASKGLDNIASYSYEDLLNKASGRYSTEIIENAADPDMLSTPKYSWAKTTSDVVSETMDEASSAIAKSGDDIIEAGADVLTKASKEESASLLATFKKKVIEVIGGLFSDNSVIAKIKKFGGKVNKVLSGEAAAKVIKEFGEKLAKEVAEAVCESAAKNIVKFTSKLSLFVGTGGGALVLTAVIGFIYGFDNANNIVGTIEDPPFMVRVIAGAVNAINESCCLGLVPLKLLFEIGYGLAKSVFGVSYEELDEMREDAVNTIAEFNKTHGTNFTDVEDFNNKDKITTKVSNFFTGKNADGTDNEDSMMYKARTWASENKENIASGWKEMVQNGGPLAALGAGAKTLGNKGLDYLLGAKSEDGTRTGGAIGSAKDFLSSKFTNAKNAIGSDINALGDATKKTLSFITDNKQALGTIVKAAFTKAIKGSGNGGEATGKSLQKEDDPNTVLLGSIGKMTDTLFTPIATISGAGRQIITNIKNIPNTISTAKDNIAATASSLWNCVVKGEDYDPPEIVDENDPMAGFQNAVSKITKIVVAPVALGARAGKFIGEKIVGVANNVKTAVSSVAKISGTNFTNALKGDKAFITLQNKPEADNPISWVSTAVDVMSKVSTFPLFGFGVLGNAASNFMTKIVSTTKSAWSTLTSAATEAMNYGSNNKTMDNYFEDKSKAEGVMGTIAKVVKFGIKVLFFPVNLMTTLIEKVKTGIENIIDKVKSKFSGLFNTINKVSEWISGGGDDSSSTTTSSSGSGSGLFVGGSSGMHRGRPRYVGRASNVQPNGGDFFVSQLSGDNGKKRFNIDEDDRKQTVAQSGCAPAAATMLVNQSLRENALDMDTAVEKALPYKAKNSGVKADYFADVFKEYGLGYKYILPMDENKKRREIINGLQSGQKVVLLGKDNSNNAKTNSPFGPNPHYVVANGISPDGKYMYINDPELKQPNAKYPLNTILKSVSMGISTNRGENSTYDDNDWAMIKATVGGTPTETTVTSSVFPKYTDLTDAQIRDIATLITGEQGGNDPVANRQEASQIANLNEVSRGGSANAASIMGTIHSGWYAGTSWNHGVTESAIEAARDVLVNGNRTLPRYVTEHDMFPLDAAISGHWSNGSGENRGQYVQHQTDIAQNPGRFGDPATYKFYDFMGTNRDLDVLGYYPSHYEKYKNDPTSGDGGATATTDGGTTEDGSSTSTGSSIVDVLLSGFDKIASAWGLTSSTTTTSTTTSSDGTTTTGDSGTMVSTDGISGRASSDPEVQKKQIAVVARMKSVYGKLKYAQGNTRYPGSRNPDDGSGDCSSTVQWAYRKEGLGDIGSWSRGQMDSGTTYVVDQANMARKPDESKLQLGDIVLYGPNAETHAEMYFGNGKVLTHGDPYALGPVEASLSRRGDYWATKRLNAFKSSGTTSVTTGSGSGLYIGRGSNPQFVSQLDPKYVNKSFNKSGDTTKQTLGDTGCAPAAAVMAVNSVGRSANMNEAAKQALKYKATNDGVSADYFSDYYRSKGLNATYYNQKDQIKNAIANNGNVVLLGQDGSNMSKSNSPFGPNSHYVLASRMSKDGKTIYVNDPESRTPERPYSTDKVLKSAQLGIGSGSRMGILRKVRRYIGRASVIPGNSNREKVWNFLRSNGFSEAAAAGVIGNLMWESGGGPSDIKLNAVESTGVGVGMVQWSRGRRTTFETYCAQQGAPWPNENIGVQCDFMLQELNTNQWIPNTDIGKGYGAEANVDLATFKNATDVALATRQFCACFERCYVTDAHLDTRISWAKAAFKEFTGKSADVTGGTIDYDSTGSTETTTTKPSVLDSILSFSDKLATAYGLTVGTTSSDSSSSSTSSSGDSIQASGSAASYLQKFNSWMGANEGGSVHREIIDTYNKYMKPGEYRMTMGDPWCHATVSAAAGATGNSSIVANTAYCPTGISQFRSMGGWYSRGGSGYDPQPGDIVYYDWGPDGTSDHVGAVMSRSGDTMTVIEGNYNDSVGTRNVSINSGNVMGVGRPKWSSGTTATTTDSTDTTATGSGSGLVSLSRNARALSGRARDYVNMGRKINRYVGRASAIPQKTTVIPNSNGVASVNVNNITAGTSSNDMATLVKSIIALLSEVVTNTGNIQTVVALLSQIVTSKESGDTAAVKQSTQALQNSLLTVMQNNNSTSADAKLQSLMSDISALTAE